jgi:hypothetical protein
MAMEDNPTNLWSYNWHPVPCWILAVVYPPQAGENDDKRTFIMQHSITKGLSYDYGHYKIL